jgi:tight adherence protein C
LHELSLGHTRKHALLELASRVQVASATEFVQAVVQAEERGNPVVDVLTIQAKVSREKRTALAEETTSRAQQAMFIPHALLAASALILIIAPVLFTIQNAFQGILR